VGLSSSLRNVAASVALAALLPTCTLIDLNELTGRSPADGGENEASDGSGNGDVPIVTTEAGGDAGDAGPPSYAATVLSDGPIAYWRLDDTTTAAAKDFSGNGHDGTYVGGVTLGVQGAIVGDPDTATQFDGNSGEMVATVPSSFDFTGNEPYSVEVWAKPASNSAGMGIVGKSAYAPDAGGYLGWYVACDNSGYLGNWRNNVETGDPAPAPGVFVHVVATYDGTSLVLYVNGQELASNATSAALLATNAPVTAGVVANWGRFTGVLDEIAVYDKVLSQARIAAHYARGTGQ
jgi:hypothetical protein